MEEKGNCGPLWGCWRVSCPHRSPGRPQSLWGSLDTLRSPCLKAIIKGTQWGHIAGSGAGSSLWDAAQGWECLAWGLLPGKEDIPVLSTKHDPIQFASALHCKFPSRFLCQLPPPVQQIQMLEGKLSKEPSCGQLPGSSGTARGDPPVQEGKRCNKRLSITPLPPPKAIRCSWLPWNQRVSSPFLKGV